VIGSLGQSPPCTRGRCSRGVQPCAQTAPALSRRDYRESKRRPGLPDSSPILLRLCPSREQVRHVDPVHEATSKFTYAAGKNQRLDRREQLARPRSVPFVIRSSRCQDAGAPHESRDRPDLNRAGFPESPYLERMGSCQDRVGFLWRYGRERCGWSWTRPRCTGRSGDHLDRREDRLAHGDAPELGPPGRT
jgi:hypothetical protein